MWGRFLSFHKYRLLKPLTRKHYRTITIVFHRRKLAFAPQRLSQTLKSLLQYPLVTSQVHWYRTQKKESALVPGKETSQHIRPDALRIIISFNYLQNRCILDWKSCVIFFLELRPTKRN
jgi:hypothetical protein